MGYYTGTATDADDFFTKLRGHATSEGWTTSVLGSVHTFQIDSFIIDIDTTMSGTDYSNMDYYVETLTGGSYNLGVMARTGSQGFHKWRAVDPIESYHVFTPASGAPFLFCAVEILPKIWRHISFGIPSKIGTWEGGALVITQYAGSLNNEFDWQNSYLGADSSYTASYQGGLTIQNDLSVLGFVPRGSGLNTRHTGFNGYLEISSNSLTASIAPVLFSQPNAGTGETLIFPVSTYHRSSGIYQRVSTLPDVAILAISTIPDATEVVIGADTWVMFPQRANGYISSNGLIEGSRNAGIAYRKNV